MSVVAQSPNYDQFSLCILLVILRTLEDLLLITIKEFTFIQTSFWIYGDGPAKKNSKKANKNNFFILLSRFCVIFSTMLSSKCNISIIHPRLRSTQLSKTGGDTDRFSGGWIWPLPNCPFSNASVEVSVYVSERWNSWGQVWEGDIIGGEERWGRWKRGGWRRPLKNCDRFITEICTIRSIWHQNICTNIFWGEK